MPADTRALLVAIEHYPGLGSSFDTPGAVMGAIWFATWLAERGVASRHMSLWLSPRDGSDPAALCAAHGLGDAQVQRFDWPGFQKAMAAPGDDPDHPLASGSFLITYYCGHGVVSGPQGLQYLVLPNATPAQFRCFEGGNWRQLFLGSGWERFSRQLWITDACRNKWSADMHVLSDDWNPGTPSGAAQCMLFGCSTGETVSLNSRTGPLFTATLLGALRDTPGLPWPDFEAALRTAAARLRNIPGNAQHPRIVIADGWDGTLSGPGLEHASLLQLLSAIAAPDAVFIAYIMSAQARAPLGFARPSDLATGLQLLHELAPVGGIPPLCEFAERISRKYPLPALDAWIAARLTPQQRAQLDERIDGAPARARLMLWYLETGSQHSMVGELDIIDVGAGLQGWSRREPKPVSAATVRDTIGLWLRELDDHIGFQRVELVVELYLPSTLLAADAYDTATVPVDGEQLELGRDHAALLRCTDRIKGKLKFKRWNAHAAAILARLPGAATPLAWATDASMAAGLAEFTRPDPAAPVWLAYDPSGPRGHAALDAAIEHGLPAVLWLHAAPGTLSELHDSLAGLLRCALDDLPAKLIQWRAAQPGNTGRALSFLLDDPGHRPAIWTQLIQPGGQRP